MAKNEYVEQVLVKVKVDEADKKKIEKAFDDLKIKDLLTDEAKKSLKEEYEKVNERLTQMKKIEKEIAELKKLGGKAAEEAIDKLTGAYKKLKKDLRKSGYKEDNSEELLKDALKKGIVDAGKKAWDTIQEFAKETFDKALEMMQEMAEYSGSSLMFSSEATQLKMTYGLTGSQAYAAQQASKETGFSSFDDFVENQVFATEETRQHWKELFERYQQTYENDVDVAKDFQQFQVEWNDFKKELSMEVINFFMENRDTIKTVLTAGIEFMKTMLQLVGGIVKLIDRNGVRSDTQRNAATSDILSSYITNNSRTNSISINNVFNGVNTSDRTDLVNVGTVTYEQVLKALD